VCRAGVITSAHEYLHLSVRLWCVQSYLHDIVMNLIKCGETRDTVLRWLAKTLMANRGRGKIHVRADHANHQSEPKVV
jgi:hypothetical protein